jgi:hypothetical protein
MPQKPEFKFEHSPMRGSWNATRMLVRGRLTDRKINYYSKRGWYANEFRAARRELMANKKARREKREGNFISDRGRLIYSPK